MNTFKSIFLSIIFVFATLMISFAGTGTSVVIFKGLMFNLPPTYVLYSPDGDKSVDESLVLNLSGDKGAKNDAYLLTSGNSVLTLKRFDTGEDGTGSIKDFSDKKVQDTIKYFMDLELKNIDGSVGAIESRKYNNNGIWCIEIDYEVFNIEKRGYRGFGKAMIAFEGQYLYVITALGPLVNNRGYGEILQQEQKKILYSIRRTKGVK